MVLGKDGLAALDARRFSVRTARAPDEKIVRRPVYRARVNGAGRKKTASCSAQIRCWGTSMALTGEVPNDSIADAARTWLHTEAVSILPSALRPLPPAY